MTRDQQLTYCKRCLHRKMDLQQGIVCSLTGEKASFQDTCPDFKEDATVKESLPNYGDPVKIDDVAGRIPVEIMNKLKAEQNLPMGILAALGIGLLGAVIWCFITLSTQFQIGYMAIAIGAGVGFGMRQFGKGINEEFGYWGAAIALLSCALGNALAVIGYVGELNNISFFEALLYFDYTALPTLMGETFSPIDILFYGFALFEGYKFSFRKIDQQELNRLGSKV